MSVSGGGGGGGCPTVLLLSRASICRVEPPLTGHLEKNRNKLLDKLENNTCNANLHIDWNFIAYYGLRILWDIDKLFNRVQFDNLQ